MKKINVYMFHYGNSPLPDFVKWIADNDIANLILGPSKEDHEELLKVPFYKRANEKKIYAFMADYWRVWIFKRSGPGLYLDTSFKPVEKKSFDNFLLSLGDKNVFVKETPQVLASSIFYLANSSIVDDYLNWYNSYIGNIYKVPISPGILTSVIKTSSFVGLFEFEDESSIFKTGVAFTGKCELGIKKEGGASWNRLAPKWWKRYTAMKYWNLIEESWIKKDFSSRTFNNQDIWISSLRKT